MHTRASLLLVLAISPLLASVSACAMFGPANVEPLYRVTNTPFSGGPSNDLSRVRGDIRRAAKMLGWTLEERAPAEILATNRKGQHFATVTIRFDTMRFSIEYRSSARLDYDSGEGRPPVERIHKLYNRWVAELERLIQQERSDD